MKGEKIARTIIIFGILLWIAQESVSFVFDSWNSSGLLMYFFILLIFADWIGFLSVLFYLISQFLNKSGKGFEILNFLAQIGLYLYGFAVILTHLLLETSYFTLIILSSASIGFLLVYHIIHKIKKRDQEGFLMQIQGMVAIIVVIFDLILGHAGRYMAPDPSYRLGLTFLPVILEFLLVILFVIFTFIKHILDEKTRKTVLIILSSIGLIGLIAGYTTWDLSSPVAPFKFIGDAVVVIGVIFYLVLSVISLKNLYVTDELGTTRK